MTNFVFLTQDNDSKKVVLACPMILQQHRENRLKQEGKRGYFKNGKFIIDSTYSAGNLTSKSRPGNNADYTVRTRSQLGESNEGFPRGQEYRRNAQNEAGGGGNSNAQREITSSRTNDYN